MRGWSLPIGKVLGVQLRIHIFFVILLVLCTMYGAETDGSNARGIGMWLMLLLAVVLREVPRAFAAASLGLPVRSLMLHPTGGLMTFAPGDSGEPSERAHSIAIQRKMLFVGPAANLLAAFVFWGAIETFAPGVDLRSKAWITPGHLLRSLVWSNVFLGLMNLLPAPPLDAGRVFRAHLTKTLGLLNGTRRTLAVGQGIAFSFMVGGLLLNSVWMSIMGSLLMIGTHLDDAPVLPQTENDTVKMRDVMMMEYSTLAASDTLVDALERSVHVLQDVFPVVRGTSMVGAVSRQSIVEALAASGNGYVQGVMTRSFQTAHPDDSLVKTLRRVMSGAGAQLLPVIEGERIVGIITPQNLSHSMSLLSHSRRLRQDA